MVVPYWQMPRNRVGRWLWIVLTAAIALVFVGLSAVLAVQMLSAIGDPDRSVDGDLIWQALVMLLCGIGAAIFGWLLVDGVRAAVRERAELRRIAEELAEAEARIRRLRGPER